MSDFDKIINDRLNEDDGEFFPRKEANWDKLSQRLADFDKANPLPKDIPQPIMRPVWKRFVWTSAAAVLVGVSGLLFWHFNEVGRVKQENARLQQEVAALKQDQQSANPETIVNRKVIIQSDTVYQTTKTVTQSGIANSPAKIPETQSSRDNNAPSVFQEKQGNLNKNKQNTAVVDSKINNSKNKTSKNQNPKDADIQRKNERQIAEMDKNKVLNTVPFDKKNESLQQQKARLNEAVVTQIDPSLTPSGLETNKADGLDNKQNAVAISPKTEEGSLKTDRKNIENVETVTQVPPSVLNPVSDKKEDTEQAKTEVLTLEKAKQDSLTQVLVALQVEKSNTGSEQVTPPIIKTDKGLKRWRQFLPKGFAVGAHGTYGTVMPKIPGVMATTGKGLSAEVQFAKNISIAVTGDLLKTDFELRERPRRFHLPDAPDPQKPNVELHQIKGAQKSSMLSINAKYVIGEKWWIQPFVTLGHSWLKIDEHAVDFVFKDFSNGQVTLKPTRVNTEKVKDLWQVGVGLEKKINRWTFGVSAEMQKDFSNNHDQRGNAIASNFGILRGGVKFNIF